MHKRDAALARAIIKAGGVAEMARKLGISSPAVSMWRRVPMARVKSVARVSGVPAAELRPDMAAAFKAHGGKYVR
jgi:DNA-binding transcriptional regulator YdaS (Cro superfamily)